MLQKYGYMKRITREGDWSYIMAFAITWGRYVAKNQRTRTACRTTTTKYRRIVVVRRRCDGQMHDVGKAVNGACD